ncbi:hypothetical protein BGX24_008051 [Mortierella sp. AD032]|nr:hypothetical protein BGX24_008051 [Mortierella sp. AD032]
MGSTNMFDLLNYDAQDQEIKVPAVTKSAPAPKPKATHTLSNNRSAGGDNRGPRKDGGSAPRPNRPRGDNDANKA